MHFQPRTRAAAPLNSLPGCEHCSGTLWPDITVPGRLPVWVCPSCATPMGRFWHRHDGPRCPLGHSRSLLTDPSGRRHICH